MLLWVSCRQVQLSSEPKTYSGLYTRLGITFSNPVLSLLPNHFPTQRGPLSQYPWIGRQGFYQSVSYACSQTVPTWGLSSGQNHKKKEGERPGNPSPGRCLFQVVPPLHNLFTVLRQSLSLFCHEFLVVISGRDG